MPNATQSFEILRSCSGVGRRFEETSKDMTFNCSGFGAVKGCAEVLASVVSASFEFTGTTGWVDILNSKMDWKLNRVGEVLGT